MKNIIRKKATALTVALIGLFTIVSCTKDAAWEEGKSGEGEVALIRLSISAPKPATPKAKTRAAVDIENNISTIKVLVFGEKDGEFKFNYMVDGDNLTTDGLDNTSFDALLRTTVQDIKLMLIANSDSAFETYTPAIGDTESFVKSRLTQPFTTTLTGSLPMWGEIKLPLGITNSANNNLSTSMLRSISRVDVIKSLNTDSFPFELQSAYVFRTNTLIQVAPNNVAAGKMIVDSPSIPTESVLNPFENIMVFTDKQHEINANDELIETIRNIYIPEAASNLTDKLEGVTSVVVGGYFNGEATLSYYRMDFDSKIEGHPFGQVLRNHKYILNIIRVWGRGWATPEDAARNKSTNVAIKIESWSDFITDMNFDGEHYFGVSTRKATVGAPAGSNAQVLVSTDMPTFTAQWADNSGVGFGDIASPGDSLDDGVFAVELSSDLKSISITALQSNQGSETVRTQNILLKAHRFEILVTIEQDKFSNAAVPIRVLSVRSYLGYLGNNDPASNTAAEARATGLRGILTNTANFGPTGVVRTAGFFLSDVTEANANTYLTDLYLSQFDVVYLPDVGSQGVISPATATRIVNWLNGNKSRFLVISYDELNRNKNTLDALGVTNITWGAMAGAFPLALKSAAIDYFTDRGPFTLSQSASIPQDFKFRNFDGTHGDINIAANPSITPILTGPRGGIALGVDYNKRVFYYSDVDLFNFNAGTGATTDNRITNTTGLINNNASLLIANMWAWIAQTALNK